MKAARTLDKTPRELSEATLGQLSPEEALDRLHWLLDNVTILDEIQERRLIAIDMAEHLAWLKENRENPKMVASIPRMYTILSNQLDKTRINIDDVSTKLAEAHATYYTEGFLLGFNKVLEMLRERDIIEGELDDSEILELVQSGIGESSEYLKKVTSKESLDE